MMHTEHGRLSELLSFMKKDMEFVAETLGIGPSGKRSADKTLITNPTRRLKFEQRLRDQQDIIAILREMLK